MNNDNFEKILHELDLEIRKGNSHYVKRYLSSLSPSSVPRPYYARLGKIARRVQGFEFALKLLGQIVRTQKPIYPEATEEEKAVYASILIKCGAFKEGLELLFTLNSNQNPEVLFYISDGMFAQWDYKSAIPYLKKYSKSDKINEYSKIIGQVNLVASYLETNQIKLAEKLLESLIPHCIKKGYNLLTGNLYEIKAQLCMANKNYHLSYVFLNKAEEILSKDQGYYYLFAKKWKAILDLMQGKNSANALNKINSIRSEARRNQLWETVRDCDKYISYYSQNKNVFYKFYFGTPYVNYKKKVLNEYPKKIELPSAYAWSLNSENNNLKKAFDLAEGHDLSSDAKLKKNQLLHRLLKLLCTDFYKPFSTTLIASELFKGEYFNIQSTPNRVNQLIKRLRNWFSKNNIPLQISIISGSYFLECTAPYSILVPQKLEISLCPQTELGKLRTKWPYQSFSLKQAISLLRITRLQAKDVLQWAVENKKIYVSGRTKDLRYRFSK